MTLTVTAWVAFEVPFSINDKVGFVAMVSREYPYRLLGIKFTGDRKATSE